MPTDLARLERRYNREKVAREEAERLLESQSKQLFEKNRELEKLSDSLEKLVAKRTSQMQNARDEALTALQVKSDFIANMSHELRTPMNGVLGIMTLLSDEDLNQEQMELVHVAQSSGQHLLAVINDILDFSKIEAKKLELELAPVEIEPYMKSVCAPFALDAKRKGIEFRYDVDASVPKVLVTDQLRLTQIISNLLSNAIKFTEQGGVFLSFTPFNTKGSYRLTVADSGIGISQQHIQSVFSAFEQADTSITRDFGGTGLGMSITKNLVEMFKGQILVESELGEGTTFHVDITFQQGDLDLADAFENDASASDIAQRNVLLVEDNPVNQLVAMKMLSKWDCHVDLADDGKVALSLLEQRSYDIVLMDLQMPNMGGIEATRIIRESTQEYAQIPIIAMTAHNSKEHVQECFDAGMQDHISKPIDRDRLEQMLLAHIPSLEVQSEHEDVEPANHVVIAGIDIESSLKRVNGDWPLLYSLIERFLDEQLSVHSFLSDFKTQNNVTEGAILFHKIKGGGANIGMIGLSEMAANFEAMLINQDKWPSDEELQALHSAIETLHNNVKAVDNPNTIECVAELRSEPVEYIRAKLTEAQTLVTKDLFATEDILRDLLACELDELVAKNINAAQDALNQFNTTAVSNAIADAIGQIG